MKRIIFISGSVLVLILVSTVIYFVFFTKKANVSIVPSSGVFPTASTTRNATGEAGDYTGNTATSSQTNTSTSAPSQKQLYEITKGPVAPGIVVFDIKATSTEQTVIIRYVNRKNGNIYSYNTSINSLSRLSNKTIPGVFSASWLSDGSRAYLRYFGTEKDVSSVATYSLKANGSDGLFFPQGITQTVTRGNKSVLTIASGVNGSIATLSGETYGRPRTIFQTPLTKIVASFAGNNKYFVYTKPSSTQYGYAFVVNQGNFEQVSGPYKGLTARISPDGTKILIGYVDDRGEMQSSLVDIKKHTTTPLPISTIADKCAWTPDSESVYCAVPTSPTNEEYPDSWYQGTVSFTDKIWRIDIKNRYAQMILNPEKIGGEASDMTSLSIDKSKKILTFLNKKDDSLWAYHISL